MPWKMKQLEEGTEKRVDKVTYSYEGTPIEVDIVLGGFCVRSTDTGEEEPYNNYSQVCDGAFPCMVLDHVLKKYGIKESPPIPERFAKWKKRETVNLY